MCRLLLIKVTEGLINCKAVKPTVTKRKNKIKGVGGLRYNNSEGPSNCHKADVHYSINNGLPSVHVYWYCVNKNHKESNKECRVSNG